MGLYAAARAGRFLVRGDHADLWFEGAGDALVVSFDNLATIDEGWPRAPWAWTRLEPLGHSVLGVQSHAKDWFRQPSAPLLLRGLEERGFFRRFRRVVLTGGASQLIGARELAARILGREVTVRLGRPRLVRGLPETATGPGFAGVVGLLAWAAGEGRPLLDLAPAATPRDGMVARLVRWVRERL